MVVCQILSIPVSYHEHLNYIETLNLGTLIFFFIFKKKIKVILINELFGVVTMI